MVIILKYLLAPISVMRHSKPSTNTEDSDEVETVGLVKYRNSSTEDKQGRKKLRTPA